MNDKTVKKEYVKFGDKVITCADLCYATQKDGAENGFVIGLVLGVEKDGRATRRVLTPLTEALKGKSKIELSAYNAYTKFFRDARKCAECIKVFCENYNITIGDRASAELEKEVTEEEGVEKKTDAERMGDFIARMMCRKSSPVSAADMVNMTLSAIATNTRTIEDAENVYSAVIKESERIGSLVKKIKETAKENKDSAKK